MVLLYKGCRFTNVYNMAFFFVSQESDGFQMWFNLDPVLNSPLGENLNNISGCFVHARIVNLLSGCLGWFLLNC